MQFDAFLSVTGFLYDNSFNGVKSFLAIDISHEAR